VSGHWASQGDSFSGRLIRTNPQHYSLPSHIPLQLAPFDRRKGSPSGDKFVVGQHHSVGVVMAVWRRQTKLDGEIPVAVDRAREGKASMGDLGC
jgi:hypothetical protein